MIPRHVHQTWKNDTVPDQWAESERAWRTMDGYEYTLWTDAMNRDLVANHYPWFLDTYDSYPYNIQRADTARYFILYHYGGVYCDLDICPKPREMRALVDYYNAVDATIVLGKSAIDRCGGQWPMTNAFMMSTKQSDFWPLVWTYLRDPFQNGNGWWKRPACALTRHFSVIFKTGPGIMNEAARTYTGTLHAIPSDLIQPCWEWDRKPYTTPNSAVTILDGGSWHSWDSKVMGALHRAYVESDTVLCLIIVLLVVALIVTLSTR